MSFINECRLVGELVEDAQIQQGSNGQFAIIKLKTGRPYITEKGTEWKFQEHKVICYKTEALKMVSEHAKAGTWMKVSGELDVDKFNNTQIVVRKTFGDIGMMFPVLYKEAGPAPQEPKATTPEPAKPALLPEQEEDTSFLDTNSSNSSKLDFNPDDIPF